jgi:hypothetical protein
MDEDRFQMTTPAQQQLARAIHDAMAPLARGMDLSDVINALFAVLLDTVNQCPNPREAADDLCEAIRANFPHG